MQDSVAFPAKRNQVGLDIITKGAAPSHVVNIEILRGIHIPDSANHHAPRFLSAASHMARTPSEFEVFFAKRNHSFACFLQEPTVHALRLSNRMDAADSGSSIDSSVSKAAPAKKSAQIISSE